LEQNVRKLLNGEISGFSLEYPWRSNAESRWFLLCGTPPLSGQKGILLTHIPITRQKLEEQFVENVPDVFWIVSGDLSQCLYVSKQYEVVWGRSTEARYQNPKNWIEAVHPEDRARVEKDFYDLAALGGFNHNYRIIHADGSVRWIRDRAFPVKDKNGSSVIRVFGTSQDITAFKQQVEIEKDTQYQGIIGNKDVALKEIIGQFNREKTEVGDVVLANLKSFVLPVIDQMKMAKTFRPDLLERLEENINNLLSPFGKKMKESHESLSARELEIANLIRLGHTTKDIVDLLNVSENTVITHRYRIRKKLKLQNIKTNLASFLSKNL
jgi:PAS domain S-box-containing protein